MFESNPISNIQYQKLKEKSEYKQVQINKKENLISNIKSTVIPICIDKCILSENLLVNTEETKKFEKLCLVDCTKKGIYVFSNLISTINN